jgi:hypothetical protein
MDYQDIKKYKGKFISLYTDYGRCFYGRPTKINKSQVFLNPGVDYDMMIKRIQMTVQGAGLLDKTFGMETKQSAINKLLKKSGAVVKLDLDDIVGIAHNPSD